MKHDMMRKPVRRLTALIMAAVFASLAAGCQTTPPAETNVSNASNVSNVSAEVKENARVSYLGPQGTYTEEAAQFFFPAAESPGAFFFVSFFLGWGLGMAFLKRSFTFLRKGEWL